VPPYQNAVKTHDLTKDLKIRESHGITQLELNQLAQIYGEQLTINNVVGSKDTITLNFNDSPPVHFAVEFTDDKVKLKNSKVPVK
jgi:hypothetical protein